MARDLKLLAWITEGGWEACVDAAAAFDASEVTLLHVADVDLPGPRGRRHEEVAARISALAGEAAEALLEDAEERLGDARRALAATAAGTAGPEATERPGPNVQRVAASGNAETVVMEAAADADVLIVAREGRRPGPHSIGHAARFVVDHAPCTVVLAWPDGAPEPGHHPKPKPKPKAKPKPKPKPEPEWR